MRDKARRLLSTGIVEHSMSMHVMCCEACAAKRPTAAHLIGRRAAEGVQEIRDVGDPARRHCHVGRPTALVGRPAARGERGVARTRARRRCGSGAVGERVTEKEAEEER